MELTQLPLSPEDTAVFGHLADTGQRFRACLVHNSASSPPFLSPTRNSVDPVSTTLGTCFSSPVLHSSMFIFSVTYSKNTPQPFPKVNHHQMLQRESHREAKGNQQVSSRLREQPVTTGNHWIEHPWTQSEARQNQPASKTLGFSLKITTTKLFQRNHYSQQLHTTSKHLYFIFAPILQFRKQGNEVKSGIFTAISLPVKGTILFVSPENN